MSTVNFDELFKSVMVKESCNRKRVIKWARMLLRALAGVAIGELLNSEVLEAMARQVGCSVDDVASIKARDVFFGVKARKHMPVRVKYDYKAVTKYVLDFFSDERWHTFSELNAEIGRRGFEFPPFRWQYVRESLGKYFNIGDKVYYFERRGKGADTEWRIWHKG